ncbi:hypothetical protein AAIE21_08485 [Paenibacillus sp. 102]|uniref:hypothetical protein n=1 Tax=Paenibacillus sp. 102 TaxID=3120823 RepID=UPI0031BB7F36
MRAGEEINERERNIYRLENRGRYAGDEKVKTVSNIYLIRFLQLLVIILSG